MNISSKEYFFIGHSFTCLFTPVGKFSKNLYLSLCSDDGEDVIKYLEFLDEKYPKFRDIKDNNGNDAYLTAAENGNVYVMEYLEKKHNWDIKVVNNYGNDAFMIAAYYGYVNVMKYLVETHNWDVNVKNKYGFNALHYAREDKRPNVIAFLIGESTDCDELVKKVTSNISEILSEKDKEINKLQNQVTDLQRQLRAIKEIIK